MSDVPARPVRLLLADVDGTLVTAKKVLTERAVAAVHRLKADGVLFAITSGRPPRGMAMLVKPLDLELPLAAFNGGVLVDPDLVVLEQHEIPQRSVLPIVELWTHMASTRGSTAGPTGTCGERPHRTSTARLALSSSPQPCRRL